MRYKYVMRLIPAVMLLVFPGSVFAEGPPQSGFFDDYSRLKPAEAHWADYIYVTEKYEQRMPKIKAIHENIIQDSAFDPSDPDLCIENPGPTDQRF